MPRSPRVKRISPRSGCVSALARIGSMICLKMRLAATTYLPRFAGRLSTAHPSTKGRPYRVLGVTGSRSRNRLFNISVLSDARGVPTRNDATEDQANHRADGSARRRPLPAQAQRRRRRPDREARRRGAAAARCPGRDPRSGGAGRPLRRGRGRRPARPARGAGADRGRRRRRPDPGSGDEPLRPPDPLLQRHHHRARRHRNARHGSKAPRSSSSGSVASAAGPPGRWPAAGSARCC